MKTILMNIILRLKITMNQVKTKKLYFGYFYVCAINTLTLDREIHIFKFFEHCLVFAIFQPLPVGSGS